MGKNRERMGRIDPIPDGEIETERVYTQEKDRYRWNVVSFIRVVAASWTAGWNEIMLLFEQRIPVFAREIHHFQGKEKRARSNLLHFRWTVKEKKKRDLLPDQLSRFIRYIISDKPLPASRVSASDSWRSSLPEFRLKYALDGPSSPTSPPTRRGERVSWRRIRNLSISIAPSLPFFIPSLSVPFRSPETNLSVIGFTWRELR